MPVNSLLFFLTLFSINNFYCSLSRTASVSALPLSSSCSIDFDCELKYFTLTLQLFKICLFKYFLSGDEIEPPDGDEYEVYRILFDITFFFFVIVILLAIIQGTVINYSVHLKIKLFWEIPYISIHCNYLGNVYY